MSMFKAAVKFQRRMVATGVTSFLMFCPGVSIFDVSEVPIYIFASRFLDIEKTVT